MANPITLLFVDLATMLDTAAVATQAAQLRWDEDVTVVPKPQVTWDRDAIVRGVIFLTQSLKHKKNSYWSQKENRAKAHAQAAEVGRIAADNARKAVPPVTSIGKTHLEAALNKVFPPGRPEEPCPF